MSISKGAFGQSAKGAFIESPMGARGWGGAFTLIVGGSSTGDNLYRLDPTNGDVIWATTVGSSGIVFNIKHGPTGRVYVCVDQASDRIYEIDRDNGNILATSLAINARSLDVDGNGKVYGARNSDNDIVRLADDLTTVEANCNATSPSSVSVDSDGNFYIAESSSGNAIATKYNSGGTLTTSSTTTGEAYSIFAPAGDYVYAIEVGGLATYIHKMLKSTMAVTATLTIGATVVVTQPQAWSTDGTHLYTAQNGASAGIASAALKIRISDMTEVARYTISSNSGICAGITKSGSQYVVGGGRSSTWDGNDGSLKSVWALNSSMSLLWSTDVSSTLTVRAISGSFTTR